MRRSLAVVPFVLAVASLARADVPVPSIEGPITGPGAIFLQSTSLDLASVAYDEKEYFVSGTATAYTNVGDLGTDGKWSVAPGETAPYETRIVVRRPSDATKFNGTVIVEWLNVSGGVDAAPDWTSAHVELLRDGFAWIGVSAQIVGVEGGQALTSVVSLPLKKVNPARYGALHHPGDSFSYDMFSQVGQAVRQASARILGELVVQRVLAAGESQSAFRMVTYVDAIHPITRLFDGYFIHSRGGILAAPLSESPQPGIAVPDTAMIRDDIDVPVLTYESETDLTVLEYFRARQKDGKRFRLWEVAGTSHYDAYSLVSGLRDTGDSPAIVGLTLTSDPIPGLLECGAPVNSGPNHFVLAAAFAALDRWVRDGKAPRHESRLRVRDGMAPTVVRDKHGNARGGVRTPQVDVPIAAFSGEQESTNVLCAIFGMTTPFDAATLRALYPTHGAFVRKYKKSLRRAVHAGVLLGPDADLMRQWAESAPIPP